jgi:hypothetical protein
MPATEEMPTTIASAGTPTATEVPETISLLQTTHDFWGKFVKKTHQKGEQFVKKDTKK